MKFVVKTHLHRSPRLGELNQIPGKPDISLETPLVLLHTQCGLVPHITHWVLKRITQAPQILQIPIVSMHYHQDAIEYYNGRLSEFIGSKESLTYITLHDPANLMQQGHHIKDKVPVFTKRDGDTNVGSPNKRVLKAVDNTVAFVEQCIEKFKNSEALKNAFVIAPIAGGYSLKSRKKCIDRLLKHDEHFQGYLIDGLHNNGAEVEFIPMHEVKPIIEHIVEQLPPHKLRAVQGCWSPLHIIKLVNCGIDIFDTSYCKIVTERSAALVFSIDNNEISEAYEINLHQNKYAEQFQPLLKHCECITCKSYTRGYIHHLLTVRELLGNVLIMIHNVHHMLRFFEKIRECIKNDNVSELEKRIEDQFKLSKCGEFSSLQSDRSSTSVE
ncbi:queuine tRNA-ribosyltransferase accessory subunit 2 [Euwallacea fornicatus]|uniref:queuine tRNA-ribosyltransferase accessory subunit 2 n=1 Tax=Euwallacea fornicatus TaxID=995702 RepID=UPI00338DDED3